MSQIITSVRVSLFLDWLTWMASKTEAWGSYQFNITYRVLAKKWKSSCSYNWLCGMCAVRNAMSRISVAYMLWTLNVYVIKLVGSQTWYKSKFWFWVMFLANHIAQINDFSQTWSPWPTCATARTMEANIQRFPTGRPHWDKLLITIPELYTQPNCHVWRHRLALVGPG